MTIQNAKEHINYGLMLAGDLYTAKSMDKTKPHMAVIVGAPVAA